MNKLIYFFLYILFSSCETPTTYNVTGVIKEIDLTNNKLLIDHNEIPGFMDKMVMYFNLHQSIDLNTFSINDSVSFNLILKNNSSYTINYIIHGKSQINSDDDFFIDNDQYTLKNPGETFNNGKFLDIDNKIGNLSDFEDDYLVISYIFSRCPMPNMCPASIVKNQYLAEYFKNKNITFLLISFDYIYDTPEVLKKKYNNINKHNLKVLSSYNHVSDIFTLTQQSGVGYWGVEENNIGHNMRTVILDKNLKFIKAFDGIDWQPSEAKKEIDLLLKHYN